MVEVLLRQQEDWKSRDRTRPYFVFSSAIPTVKFTSLKMPR